MSFNTGLSGLRAAQSELSITGNNIANASTVGFKQSRAEFSDLFAASSNGVTSRAIGNGTLLSNVGQQFSQGNISFTENNLDLAINGSGFFMVSDGGATQYTRSGIFGLDKDGFVVTNQGAQLQGFQANGAGQIGGNLIPLQISTQNQSPQSTTGVNSVLNLDSEVADLSANNGGVLPEFDPLDPATYNHSTSSTIFDSLGNSHVLSTFFVKDETAATGSIDNRWQVYTQVDGENLWDNDSDISTAPNLLQHEMLFDSNGALTSIRQVDTRPAVPSVASVTGAITPATAAVSAAGNSAVNANFAFADIPAVAASLTSGAAPTGGALGTDFSASTSEFSFNVTITGTGGGALDSDITVNINSNTYANVGAVIADINGQLAGSDAEAYDDGGSVGFRMTTAGAGTLALTAFDADPDGGADNIVAGTANALLGIDVEAGVTTAGGANGADGTNLSTANNATFDVSLNGAAAQTVTINTNHAGDAAALLTDINADLTGVTASYDGTNQLVFTASDGTTGTGSTVQVTNLAGQAVAELGLTADATAEVGAPAAETAATLADVDFSSFINSATPRTVTFDLVVTGAPASTTTITLTDPGNLANSGEILALITAQLPAEVAASVNSPTSTDGLITFTDTTSSTINSLQIIGSTLQSFAADNSEITIADWNPGSGASIASFDIDFSGTTQFGSPFAVNGSSQDGFTTGRLVGVDIDDGGAVQARFSNGQSQVLGGVALANFNNDQGLTPIGDNSWTESFDSGSPVIGSPGTSSLGLIQSGALEDSNVDLSDELVGLILAQRNFQANAKTIETADALTQTIINIR